MSTTKIIHDFFNQRAPIWDHICSHDEQKIQKIIALCNVQTGESVLDVACGTGVFTAALLHTEAAHITALDLSEKMIEIAQEKISDSRVTFVAQDLFDFSGDYFDCIVIYSAYPHFFNRGALAEKIYALLKPNGRFIVAHSTSKEGLNAHHKHHAADISSELLSAEMEFNHFVPFFKRDQLIDNATLYLFSGVRLG